MFKQEVVIKLMDEFSNNFGILTIKPSYCTSIEEYEYDIDNEILLKNVPTVDYLDNTTPIIYFIGFSSSLPKLMFLEETEYQILFESEDVDATFDVLYSLTRFNNAHFKQLDFPLGDNNTLKIAGTINFRSYVGKSFLDVRRNDVISNRIPIEVRSKKINYLSQYSVMISELSQHFLSLIFEVNSPLFQDFEFDYGQKKTYYEEFMFLEYLFRDENLPSIFEYLSKNLHSQLKNHIEVVPLSFASNIDQSALKNIVSNPNNLIRSNSNFTMANKLNGYLPREIDKIKHESTIDIPENRFFKYFLESIQSLIGTLLLHPKTDYIMGRLLDFKDEVEYYLSNKIFKDVSSMDYVPFNSQILQKKEGYREIFQYFLMLEFSFRLSWDEINDQLNGFEKKLSELYEYWCYFKLLKVLNDLSEIKIDFDDIFRVNKDKWSKKKKNELFYNLRFSKKSPEYVSYSLIFKPDYTLKISFENKVHYIHFDAKYRSELEINNESDDDIDKRDYLEETKSIFKNGDIYKMHTYKDSILKSHGAFVLYPGNSPKNFQVFESQLIPSVGAFSLTPGNDENDEEELSNFIKGVLKILVGNGKYYIYEWHSVH